ncbi:MAG: hypothetical protein Q4F75_07835 [Pseudomonadota bacterium]|nr:hypothetical protein [Pseudomonadota bacterium]
MNTNFNFLLLGASLSLIPQYATAQCAVTDCQQLGYTSLKSCEGGLKCPFGEYWACPKVTKAELGSCNGYAQNCKIGQILNNDGTCSNDKVSGKTPIGVVVYIGNDNCGQALALNSLGTRALVTETDYMKVPDLPTYTTSTAEQDFDSCRNTISMTNYQEYAIYPAAWTAINYSPSSDTKGKWCLPAAGIMRSLINNYYTINRGLGNADGEILPVITEDGFWHWTSTQADGGGWACWIAPGGDSKCHSYYKDSQLAVRPVIAF